MSIGITLVWFLIATGAFGFGLYRWLRGRKDDKMARAEFAKRAK
jgi:hypothetical protein